MPLVSILLITVILISLIGLRLTNNNTMFNGFLLTLLGGSTLLEPYLVGVILVNVGIAFLVYTIVKGDLS